MGEGIGKFSLGVVVIDNAVKRSSPTRGCENVLTIIYYYKIYGQRANGGIYYDSINKCNGNRGNND